MSKRDPWVLAGLFIVGLTAIVASFDTLMGLAAWVGWRGWAVQILLPICIDVLALVSGRVWLADSATMEARRYARGVSLTALAVSVIGNAIGHVVAMDSASTFKIVLAIVVGSIPPIALGAVGHLATLATMQAEETASVVVEEPVELPAESTPEPEPEPVQEQSNRRGRGRPKTKEPIARAFWDHEREAGRFPTGADLARVAGADPTSGCNWRRAWLAEEEARKTAMSTGTASFALVTA